MIRAKILAGVGCAALLFGLNSGCGGKYEVHKETRLLMGTVVEITIGHPDRELARKAAARAFGEIERVDALLSSHNPESEITGLNASGAAGPVAVSDEVFALLARAESIRVATAGAFDVTVGPLVELWAFDQSGRVPGEGEIASALASVGGARLELDGDDGTVRFLTEGMRIDLGAIGKGYAVDRAVAILESAGIESAIIDAGGDIRLLGSRPGKDFWRIAVRHPREPSRFLLGLDLAGTAVVTSGDYERFFMVGDTRYHHILDPRTGFPARGCSSVTVVAPDTAGADAYATAAFVLGPEEGLRYLRSLPGVEGIIVDANGELLWTDKAKLGQ
jgi:thiamine biosynthesis lipoprotein